MYDLTKYIPPGMHSCYNCEAVVDELTRKLRFLEKQNAMLRSKLDQCTGEIKTTGENHEL